MATIHQQCESVLERESECFVSSATVSPPSLPQIPFYHSFSFLAWLFVFGLPFLESQLFSTYNVSHFAGLGPYLLGLASGCLSTIDGVLSFLIFYKPDCSRPVFPSGMDLDWLVKRIIIRELEFHSFKLIYYRDRFEVVGDLIVIPKDMKYTQFSSGVEFKVCIELC